MFWGYVHSLSNGRGNLRIGIHILTRRTFTFHTIITVILIIFHIVSSCCRRTTTTTLSRIGSIKLTRLYAHRQSHFAAVHSQQLRLDILHKPISHPVDFAGQFVCLDGVEVLLVEFGSQRSPLPIDPRLHPSPEYQLFHRLLQFLHTVSTAGETQPSRHGFKIDAEIREAVLHNAPITDHPDQRGNVTGEVHIQHHRRPQTGIGV
mmetsp:Transcript_27446/g.27848  ORF Transcript_27446/g.27848 Transcript_27446/m.27848 type:complete len:205 (+) Transcript_27446:204-818(+)